MSNDPFSEWFDKERNPSVKHEYDEDIESEEDVDETEEDEYNDVDLY